MIIIDGKKIAAEIYSDLKAKIIGKKMLGLAVILIGSDPASYIYIKQKEKAAKELGVLFCSYIFSEDQNFQDVFDTIEWLNQDDQINGIVVQLPLPQGWPTDKILKAVNKDKDVDGLIDKKTPSPFILSICEVLKKTKVKNKKILALVKSDIFGKKLCSYLKKQGYQAEYMLKKTKNTQNADVLICAWGKPKYIKAQDIKNKAVLIDGGISNRQGKIMGDIDYKSVKQKAKVLSPVPGGLGPVTVAMLYQNLIARSK